jgi:hypothetical protein
MPLLIMKYSVSAQIVARYFCIDKLGEIFNDWWSEFRLSVALNILGIHSLPFSYLENIYVLINFKSCSYVLTNIFHM